MRKDGRSFVTTQGTRVDNMSNDCSRRLRGRNHTASSQPYEHGNLEKQGDIHKDHSSGK